MGYYEFDIKLPDESKDALIELMRASGLLGLIEADGGITAYFSDVSGIETIIGALKESVLELNKSGLASDLSYDYVFVPEQDWNETWKTNFRPIDVGENLSILPPWEEPDIRKINLVIDPGMAFGTGHHETTRFCLKIIEQYSSTTKNKESFLDLGTGTGILAIAAAKLGFEKITAIDSDPLAIDAARRNVVLNGLSNICLIEGEIGRAAGVYDMIAANLISETLIKIAPEIAERLAPEGIALLSGMLLGQETDVLKAMESCGLNLAQRFEDGRWISITVTKNI
ncbi:MAG: 50S ribosomal protein L11 methyltransferase [Nitrospirae bacterium]|nr:MAG: 50S ribosomal protein L11 methyltransferase [Nitrospirota bacterium]